MFGNGAVVIILRRSWTSASTEVSAMLDRIYHAQTNEYKNDTIAAVDRKKGGEGTFRKGDIFRFVVRRSREIVAVF